MAIDRHVKSADKSKEAENAILDRLDDKGLMTGKQPLESMLYDFAKGAAGKKKPIGIVIAWDCAFEDAKHNPNYPMEAVVEADKSFDAVVEAILGPEHLSEAKQIRTNFRRSIMSAERKD